MIFLPALRTPFLLDDYLQASMIEGTFPSPRSPVDLYNFVSGSDRARLIERGIFPWWSHPAIEIRFFRPLSSALRFVDHRALGHSPILPHLHSFAWWMAAVLAARLHFRRALSSRAASIATLVFALAPCHAIPLAWLANREALLSITFGTAALAAYTRFRDESKLGFGALATLLFALAAASGEYALCFGGYVLAFEIVRRPKDGFFRRALGLLPFVAPAAAYLALRRAGGYGTFGSGFYTDPFRETSTFLAQAPRRLLSLLADGWLALDDESLAYETSIWVVLLVVITMGPLVFLAVRRAFLAQDEARRRSVGFLMLGSALALLPVLAVVPSPRLLGASLLGVAPAIGMLLDHAWFEEKPEKNPRPLASQFAGYTTVLLGFLHLVHGPATAFLLCRRMRNTAVEFVASAADLRERIGDPSSAHVNVVRASAGAFFVPFGLGARGQAPERWRILAQTAHVLVVRRGPRTFDFIAGPGQSVVPVGIGQLFRSSDAPFAAGEVHAVPGLRATILEVNERGPRVVRFEVDEDPASSSDVWITETTKGFPDADLPSIGMGKPYDP